MKTIRDFLLNDKKVIIRVDFNVPIKDGIISDDNRIKESLKTINYALDNGAKVILLSHLGRVKTLEDKSKTLRPIASRLSELLNKDVIFIDETRGEKLEKAVDNLVPGDVILIENTRFEDLNDKAESKNNKELGEYWATLGDIYINDAFGTSHREHASNVGIATNLESGIGFLIEKELSSFKPVIENPNRPYTIILGGAKVNDKIELIKSLVTKADYLLIGGGMAFTFLKASELEIGSSLLDIDSLDFCKEMLIKYKEKIILPIDVITDSGREIFITDIKKEEKGLDIGKQTVELFKSFLDTSKTIVWNGPVGLFEEEQFSKGTIAICDILKNINALKIAGGGDTASAIKKFGFTESFTHISTGGGASLELLEGKKLPGIEVIK